MTSCQPGVLLPAQRHGVVSHQIVSIDAPALHCNWKRCPCTSCLGACFFSVAHGSEEKPRAWWRAGIFHNRIGYRELHVTYNGSENLHLGARCFCHSARGVLLGRWGQTACRAMLSRFGCWEERCVCVTRPLCVTKTQSNKNMEEAIFVQAKHFRSHSDLFLVAFKLEQDSEKLSYILCNALLIHHSYKMY